MIVSGGEKQAAMEAGGTIYIKNAEVTAEAGKQASAIKAEQIKIENAAVTVSPDTDSNTSAIQSDNITLIGENTVSTSTGDKNIYSSTPKDENGNEIVDTIPVSRIVLNKTSIALEVNKKEILAATVLPDNATESSVLWSSSNETIATVSQVGEVTGLAAGTAVITCNSKRWKRNNRKLYRNCQEIGRNCRAGTNSGAIDRAVNGTINGAIDGTVNRAIDRTVNGAIDRTVNGAIDRAINRAIDRTVNGAINRAINGTVDRTDDGNA